MYGAIRQYGLLTNEPVDMVLQGIREGFIPIIRNAPGFLAYYALDSGSGTLTSISIFEQRAGAEKSNKLAEDWVGMTLSSALPTSPEIIIGEVGAHEINLIKLGIRENNRVTANFGERAQRELRRPLLPHTPVNGGKVLYKK